MYTITKYKRFMGTDGHGFNATLCRDGKPVANMIDSGCGGCIDYSWLDFHAPRVDVPWLDWEDKPITIRATPEEALLYEECRGKTWTSNFKGMESKVFKYDPDYLVGQLINDHENTRRFKTMCKSKTLVAFRGDPEGEYRVFKVPFSPRVKQELQARYGDKITEFVNERYVA